MEKVKHNCPICDVEPHSRNESTGMSYFCPKCGLSSPKTKFNLTAYQMWITVTMALGQVEGPLSVIKEIIREG